MDFGSAKISLNLSLWFLVRFKVLSGVFRVLLALYVMDTPHSFSTFLVPIAFYLYKTYSMFQMGIFFRLVLQNACMIALLTRDQNHIYP